MFLGFQVEYLNIVCQIECSNRRLDKFVRDNQLFLSAVTYLRIHLFIGMTVSSEVAVHQISDEHGVVNIC